MTGNRPEDSAPESSTAGAAREGPFAGLVARIEATAPLFPAAVGLIVGIALDHFLAMVPRAAWVAYAFFLLLGLGITWCNPIGRASSVLGLLVTAFGVGALLHLNAQRVFPPDSIVRAVPVEREVVRIAGTVASEPRILTPRKTFFSRWSFRNEQSAFVLRVTGIGSKTGWSAASGLVRVLVREPILDLRQGEVVEVTGYLGALPPPRNPGMFDWSGWQRRQGVVASVKCAVRDNVTRLDPTAVARDPWISRMRRWVSSLVTESVVGTEGEAGLLDALVLGQRSEIADPVNEAFIKAGCVHFLAASGTNVAMVASFVWLVTRWLRLTRRGGALCVFVAIVLYAALAEPRPPILRSAITGSLFCAALAVGRERCVLNWLSAAAIVLLVADPATVFDIGFQLSFLAVLGVAFLTGPITRVLSPDWLAHATLESERRLMGIDDPPSADEPSAGTRLREDGRGPASARARVRGWRGSIRYVAISYLAASLAAWLAGLPVVAGTFHRVQPYGALGSCLALPLVYLAMVVGFLRAVLAVVFPPGADALGVVLHGLVSTLLRLVEQLASLPGASLDVTAPPATWITVFYLLLLAIALRHQPSALRDRETPAAAATDARRWSRWRVAAMVLGGAFVITSAVWAWPRTGAHRLVATALSVGDGSATVLELPNGEVVLVDAGSRSLADAGRDVVQPFLRDWGIREIHEVILTRARMDRFNGVPSAIEASTNVSIRVAPGFAADCAGRAPCRALLRLLSESEHLSGAFPESADVWERGGVTFRWVDLSSAAAPARGTGGDEPPALKSALWVGFERHALLITPDLDRRDCVRWVAPDALRADAIVASGGDLSPEACEPLVRKLGARILVENGRGSSSAAPDAPAGAAPEREMFDLRAFGAVRIEVDLAGMRARYASERGRSTGPPP